MKRLLLLFAALCLLLPALCAVAEEPSSPDDYVPTDQWQPPVIDEEEALKSAPWLLVLKVAQGEVGYVEGPATDESKYGEWFGDRLTAWCAEFVTWCVNEADQRYGTSMLYNLFPFYGKPKDGAPWFLQRERFVCAGTMVPKTKEKMWLIGSDHYITNKEYVPQPGDYMWFTYHTMESGTEHVALVEGVSREPDGTLLVHVIEGNNPDRVWRAVYPQTWKFIYGYGTPVRRAHRVLRYTVSSDDAGVVMQYLADMGFLRESALKGILFTEEGTKALSAYQKENGLPATGKVDIETRAFMEQDPLFREMIAAASR